MSQAIEAIMFMAWLLCGCCVETILDDWRSPITFVIGLIVMIAAAIVLGSKDK